MICVKAHCWLLPYIHYGVCGHIFIRRFCDRYVKNYSASKINWQKKRAKNNLKNIFILFLHTKPQSKHTHSLTTCKTSHIHINNLYSVWSLLKLNLVHKCGILNGGVFSQGLLFLDIKNLVLGFAKKSYFTTECKADTGTETIYSVHF